MKNDVCCVVLLCVLSSSAWGQAPAAVECDTNAACVALVAQAQQQSKAGQLAEAEKSYKLAFEVSHDARLLFNIARVLDKQAQREEAMKYYRQFIQASVEDDVQKAKAREFLTKLEAKLVTARPPQTVPPSVELQTSSTAPIPPTALPASVAPAPSTTVTGGASSSKVDESIDPSVPSPSQTELRIPQFVSSQATKAEYGRRTQRAYSLGFGIPLLVGGTVMAGFGIGALSVRDQCALPSAAYWSVPTCGGTYATLGPGIGLLVSGVVISSGATVILANPKSKRNQLQTQEKATP